VIYRFKQRLCYLLLKKHRNRKQCEALVPRFLRAVYQLRPAGITQLVQLGHTLAAWSEEIVAMWRFTRNNAITEGFHNKMELISRQAYGFRNFQNYRLRVKVFMFLVAWGSEPAPVFGVEPPPDGQAGGEGGIRTPGRGLGPYDGLANRCFRPLSHLSGAAADRPLHPITNARLTVVQHRP
jgi:hypothetical protein